jgi:hypothetical protein
MYGFSADPTKLHIFGSVCWAFIPKSKRLDGKLGNSGVKCRFLGYGDDDSLDECKHGFKLLRELDGKNFYSLDVYFKENEPMIALDPAEKIGYDAFYESLEISELDPPIASRDENESNDEEGDYLQKKCSPNSRFTPFNNSDQLIEKAIDNGHIVTSRGSELSFEMSIENLVNLARECNLTMADVKDPDFNRCFSVANFKISSMRVSF